MNNLIEKTDLAQCKNTIKSISYDKEHNESMIESLERVVDFDKVKTKYLNNLHRSEEDAKSVDGLMVLDAKLAMVEFKNGDMGNERNSVHHKIKDSLLIFNDIVRMNISYTRDNLDFILVYNRDKNPISKEEKRNISDSKSRFQIGSILMRRAGQEFVRWGFLKYKGLYFRNVHTYDIDQFKEVLDRNNISYD